MSGLEQSLSEKLYPMQAALPWEETFRPGRARRPLREGIGFLGRRGLRWRVSVCGAQDDPVTARGAAHNAALDAQEQVPPRIDSRYVFTTTRKCPGIGEPGPFDVANFRRRVWGRRSTRPGSRSPRGLRPPVDVRLERARRRDHDVRAGPDHGHEREDDRAALGTLIDTAHDTACGWRPRTDDERAQTATPIAVCLDS